MTCDCGKPAEEGKDTCFRCRVSGVGFSFQGGGLIGSASFHQSRRDYLQEHVGVSSEKQLARERPHIERA